MRIVRRSTLTFCLQGAPRPLTYRQHVIMSNLANFYNTFVTAIALENIQWKYYILFVCLNVVYGKSSVSLA